MDAVYYKESIIPLEGYIFSGRNNKQRLKAVKKFDETYTYYAVPL